MIGQYVANAYFPKEYPLQRVELPESVSSPSWIAV